MSTMSSSGSSLVHITSSLDLELFSYVVSFGPIKNALSLYLSLRDVSHLEQSSVHLSQLVRSHLYFPLCLNNCPPSLDLCSASSAVPRIQSLSWKQKFHYLCLYLADTVFEPRRAVQSCYWKLPLFRSVFFLLCPHDYSDSRSALYNQLRVKPPNLQLYREAIQWDPLNVLQFLSRLRFTPPESYDRDSGSSKGSDACTLTDCDAMLFREDLWKLAVQTNGRSLQYVPQCGRTRSLCLLAVASEWRALDHVPESERDYLMYLCAVSHQGNALMGVPESMRDQRMCESAVLHPDAKLDKDAMPILRHIPVRFWTPEIVRSAIARCGMELSYLLPDAQDQLMAHMMMSPGISDGTPPLPRLTQSGATIDSELLRFAAEADNTIPEFGSSILSLVPPDLLTPDLYARSVRRCGWHLNAVPAQLRSYELCMIAVQADGEALNFVPKQLITPDMVYAAVRSRSQSTHFLHLVPRDIRPRLISPSCSSPSSSSSSSASIAHNNDISDSAKDVNKQSAIAAAAHNTSPSSASDSTTTSSTTAGIPSETSLLLSHSTASASSSSLESPSPSQSQSESGTESLSGYSLSFLLWACRMNPQLLQHLHYALDGNGTVTLDDGHGVKRIPLGPCHWMEPLCRSALRGSLLALPHVLSLIDNETAEHMLLDVVIDTNL